MELKRELPLKIRTTNISYLKIPPTPPTGVSFWTFHECLGTGQRIAVSTNQDGAASAATVRKVFAFAARPQHPSLTPWQSIRQESKSFPPQKYFHCLHFGFGNKFSTRGSDRCFLNPTVDKQRSHCWDVSSAGRRESGWLSSAWPRALFWLCLSPRLLFIESLLIIAPVVYFCWAWENICAVLCSNLERWRSEAVIGVACPEPEKRMCFGLLVTSLD